MDKVASEGDIPYISQQIGSWPSVILCSLKTLSGTLWVWKFHLIAKNVHFLSKTVATKTKNTNDNWKPKSEKPNTGPQTPPETQSPFPLRFWNRVPEILVSIYHWSLKAKGYKIALAIIQGSVLRGLGKLMNKGELVWGNDKPRDHNETKRCLWSLGMHCWFVRFLFVLMSHKDTEGSRRTGVWLSADRTVFTSTQTARAASLLGETEGSDEGKGWLWACMGWSEGTWGMRQLLPLRRLHVSPAISSPWNHFRTVR